MDRYELPSTYIFCNDVGSLDSISVAVGYNIFEYHFEGETPRRRKTIPPIEWTQTIKQTKDGTWCTATHFALLMQANCIVSRVC